MTANQVSVSFTPRVVDLWRAALVVQFGLPIRLIMLSGVSLLIGILDAVWVNGDLSTSIAIVFGFFAAFWLFLPLLILLVTTASSREPVVVDYGDRGRNVNQEIGR
jgi:hypothetical protein